MAMITMKCQSCHRTVEIDYEGGRMANKHARNWMIWWQQKDPKLRIALCPIHSKGVVY